MTLVGFIGCAFAVYTAIGLCTSVGFVTFGLKRVLPQPASFTPGARLLLLPGAFALWPYVLARMPKNSNR